MGLHMKVHWSEICEIKYRVSMFKTSEPDQCDQLNDVVAEFKVKYWSQTFVERNHFSLVHLK